MSVNEFFTAVSSDLLATVLPLNSTDNKVGMNRKYETMKYSTERKRERVDCPFMNLSFVQHNQKKCNKETCGIL